MARSARYVLHKKIARGGMAEIFLGKQIGEDGFQRICCIKRIRPDFVQEDEFVKMFRDEAHICKRLQHANIVRVEGFEEVEGSYAIIMELVSGGDLRSVLAACEKAESRLTVPMALYVIAEASRGLHYAHTKKDEISGEPLGIVHRDISPQNILVSFEGEVKVTDFGIAEADDRSTETTPGVIKGKYAYMSPEQISGQPVDARTDIFALSIVLWETLAMKKLFWAENEVQTIQKVRNGMIEQDLRQLNPQVTSELYQIVMRGLARDANMRYANAAEFETTLRRYLSGNFVDFTASTLEQFMKEILNERLAEMETQIKTALSEIKVPHETATLRRPTPGLSEESGQLNLGIASEGSLSVDFGEGEVNLTNGEVLPAVDSSGVRAQDHPGSFSGTNYKVVPEQAWGTGTPSYQSQTSVTRIGTRGPPPGMRERRAKPRKPAPPKSNYLVNVSIAALVAAFVIAFGYWGYRKTKVQSDVRRVSVYLRPELVKMNYRDQPLYNSRYVSGPLKLSYSSSRQQLVVAPANRKRLVLPYDEEGANLLEFHRAGFASETMDLQMFSGAEKYLILNPLEQMAPTRISVESSQAPVWIILDDMLVRTELSSRMDVKDLVFGAKHTLKVYPKGFQSAEGGFVCSFKPRSTSWSAPFIVLINPNQKKCSFPSRL